VTNTLFKIFSIMTREHSLKVRKSNTNSRLRFSSVRNFISRVSQGSVLKATSTYPLLAEQMEEIERLGQKHPDVARILIDRALKEEVIKKLNVDVNSQGFRKELSMRILVKNAKQKFSFAVGSIPTFTPKIQNTIHRYN
jgi:hypothetical protein